MTRALQTTSKQKALWSAERQGENRERGGAGRGGGRLSRFIAKSRGASTEHSFNQTVTSPPGAAQRLENRSARGSLSCLCFCSHTSSAAPAARRLFPFYFFFFSRAGAHIHAKTIEHSCLCVEMKRFSSRDYPSFPRMIRLCEIALWG